MIEENKIIEFLTLLNIEPEDIFIDSDGEIVKVDIAATDDYKGILIGRHARTLDDLQRILSLIVNNELEEHQKILLDIGGYRKERLDKILAKADELAAIVKSTGMSKSLPRLSPTERRQVHIHFSEDESINTYSQGEGEERRLFIASSAE